MYIIFLLLFILQSNSQYEPLGEDDVTGDHGNDDSKVRVHVNAQDDDDDEKDGVQEDEAEPYTSAAAISKQLLDIGHRKPFKRKQKETAKEDVLLHLASEILIKKICQAETKEDPDDTFGKHVANELRNILDPRAKQFAKLKIQNILFEAQWGDWDQAV